MDGDIRFSMLRQKSSATPIAFEPVDSTRDSKPLRIRDIRQSVNAKLIGGMTTVAAFLVYARAVIHYPQLGISTEPSHREP